MLTRNKEPKTTVKSIALKVKNTNDKLVLFHLIKEYSKVCSKMYDDIMSYSGLLLKDRDGQTVINSTEVIQTLAKKYNVLPETFTDFFTEFSQTKNARSYVAFLCQDETKAQNETANKLVEIGIFPIKYSSNSDYNFLGKTGGYKYAVVGSLHNKISSWIECNENTNKEYSELKELVDNLTSTLLERYPKEVLTDLTNWLNESEKYNFSLGKKSWKFFSFFENQLWTSLKNGVPIEFGEWTTNDGKSIFYSCNKNVVELLYVKYKSLWNTVAPILLDKSISDYIDILNDFNRKREYSSYTKISLDKNPVRLLLGKNYIPFRRNDGIVHDTVNKTLTFSIPYPQSNNKEFNLKNKTINLVAAYTRKYKGKRFYFENLKVSPISNEKGSTGNYLFEYSINGKRDRKAVLCEPSIRLVITNSNINLDNPKITDFELFVDLSLNVESDAHHEFDEPELKKIRTAFSSAHSVKSSENRTKSLDEESILNSTTKDIRIMAIDLGLRNPFAYSIISYKNNKIELVTSGVYKDILNAGKNLEQRKQYGEFSFVCRNVKDLITHTRYYLDGHKPTISTSYITNINNYFIRHIPGFIPYNADEYIKWVDSKKETPLVQFKNKENGWIVRDITFLLKNRLSTLLNERKKFNSFENHFSWIRSIDLFIRTMRSYQMIGISKDISQKTGKTYQPYRNLKDKILNIKLDYMKKLAFHVSEIAKNNNCCILVTEKLENLRGNVYNDKDRNLLYNTWPVGQIKHYMENAVSNYGILLADADERNTSQVYINNTESVHWGYRNEDDLDELWWEDKNGRLYLTHADENASKNIGMRYLTNHTNQFSIEMCKINDTTYVPKSTLLKKEDGKKREKGFLFKSFSTTVPVFELKDGYLHYTPGKTISLKHAKVEKAGTWYAINKSFTTLMDKNKRNLVLDELEKKVVLQKNTSASSDVIAKTPDPLATVNSQ